MTLKSMTNPYTETLETQHGTGRTYVVRTFDETVEIDDLVWHRDTTSRKVHVLSGVEWKLQHDDELPVHLEIGKEYYIPKMQYHRLIKGEGNLVIRIENI